jgi:hypothetical protein
MPADLTTVQNVQLPVTPNFTGDEAFFEFLLSASPTKFADLKALADKGGAMTPFAINAKITVTIDNTFEVVSQQLAHNVVGLIERAEARHRGLDPGMFGLHHANRVKNGGKRQRGTALALAVGPCQRHDGRKQEILFLREVALQLLCKFGDHRARLDQCPGGAGRRGAAP